MRTIVLHPVTHFSFYFRFAVVVVIRHLAEERTSRVDRDGIRVHFIPVNQFTSILFMMFYGIVQDKLGLKKPLIWCMSFIPVLTGSFMIYVYEPLLQSNFSVESNSLGALFFWLGVSGGMRFA